jgi:hypothetical protein
MIIRHCVSGRVMTLLETMKEGYWEVVVDNLNKGKVR